MLFIHGMFMTGKCWEGWVRFFKDRGVQATAADWPLHDQDPARLRERPPPGAGELSLQAVIRRFAKLAQEQPSKPILIGHSVGGLIVQILISRGLAAAGVCLSSVAPNRMMTMNRDYLLNSLRITNPFKGNEPFRMSPSRFHRMFANTLTRAESDAAYARYAVNESRKVLRDCLGEDGRIDTSAPHAPLLFVSGLCDKVIPAKLNRKNAEVWTNPRSVVDYKEFAGRSHLIIAQNGWEEVASGVAGWLEQQVTVVKTVV